MLVKQLRRLNLAAAAFFSVAKITDDIEAQSFQRASLKTFNKD